MNNVFCTMNIAMIAALSFVWDKKSVFIAVSGILINALWIKFILNFKRLNKEKFNVINELEKYLPYEPFNKEWEYLTANKKYKDCTKYEIILAILFVLLYIVFICVIW